jgi:predicted transcriptional regulator of viral defense system
MKKNGLNNLKKSPFDVSYAESKGVSERMLRYYLTKGLLVRLSHGVYAFSDSLSFDFESLVKEKMAQAPQGILGMNSALKLYGLTEDDLPFIDLMVPKTNIPKKKIEDVKIHQVMEHLFNEGMTKVRGIKVTTIERTIVDFMKRRGTPKDARIIIQEAQKKKIKINFRELERLAKLFHVKSKLTSLVENL